MTTSAVVTGAARGIGRAIAEHLISLGHRVVIADVLADQLASTAAEIGAAAWLVQDVREAQSHRELARLAAEHGRLVAWFNNAGTGEDGLMADMPEDVVRKVIEVNLLGCIWGMQAALEAFGSAGGDIVNTASLAGLGPVPAYSVYASTKAAVVSLSSSVNLETPKNVRVHAICPDAVQTAMLHQQTPGNAGTALVHAGLVLSVDDIAAAAVGLLGRRRVVRTVPGWRAALQRTSALSPGLAAYVIPLFVALGQRRAQRWLQADEPVR